MTTVYVSLSCADKKLKAAKIAGSVVFTSVKLLMTLLSTFAVPFRRNRLIPSYHLYSIYRKAKGIKSLIFLIPLSLQPNVVDRYFKPCILLNQIIKFKIKLKRLERNLFWSQTKKYLHKSLKFKLKI